MHAGPCARAAADPRRGSAVRSVPDAAERLVARRRETGRRMGAGQTGPVLLARAALRHQAGARGGSPQRTRGNDAERAAALQLWNAGSVLREISALQQMVGGAE